MKTGTASRLVPKEVFSINFLRRESIPLPVRRIAVYVALAYLAANLVFMMALFGASFLSGIERHGIQIGRASCRERV